MSEQPRDYLADRDPGDERPLPPLPCPTCGGEGKVADSDDQEPWSAWANLPPGANSAVVMGFVRPIDCPECGGTGRVEIERLRISPERLATLEAATADGARPAYVHGVGFVEYADTPEVSETYTIRMDILAAMEGEAAYQDAQGHSPTHPVAAWLLIMQQELREATDAWVGNRGDRAALAEILQVMTVGMRCLEQHGVVERDGVQR